MVRDQESVMLQKPRKKNVSGRGSLVISKSVERLKKMCHVGYADSTPLKGHYGGGAGLGLTLQGSTGLRNTCHPVLTHLTDLPLATGYTVPGFHFN